MSERTNQSFEDGVQLLGHNVKITLNWDDPAGTIIGYFFGVDIEGSAVVDTVEGRRYVWPVLFVEHWECAHMPVNIREDEVHTIELSMAMIDNLTTVVALETFMKKLRERGFVDLDRVSFIPASMNQRAEVTAKRSVKYDAAKLADTVDKVISGG